MSGKAPAWWYPDLRGGKQALLGTRAVDIWLPRLLAPIAAFFSAATRLRFAATTPYHSKIPVICIGNFTAGGAGKTPTALAVAQILRDLGYAPVFLSRGYGGTLAGPHRVDLAQDRATDVGDEPLLLVQHGPAFIARDRAAGARMIEAHLPGPKTVIIMDDGFQNPGLAKNLSLVVLDGLAGVGNGRVMPAGPLRVSLAFQMKQADMLLVIGGETLQHSAADSLVQQMEAFGKPVFTGDIAARGETKYLQKREVIAYAGIARPEKFFALLEQLGATVRTRLAYGDHHVFTDSDAAFLLELSKSKSCPLITTEKDLARLPNEGLGGKLRKSSMTLPVGLKIDGAARLADELRDILNPKRL